MMRRFCCCVICLSVCVTPCVSCILAGTQSEVSCVVAVINPHDAVNVSNGFTYRSQLTPVITQVSPRRGGTAGGTRLTITGSGFRYSKGRKHFTQLRVHGSLIKNKCSADKRYLFLLSLSLLGNTGITILTNRLQILLFVEHVWHIMNCISVCTRIHYH